MGAIGAKLQEKINESNAVSYGDTIAVIDSYDNVLNTATIHFDSPNGGSSMKAVNVAFSGSNGGVMSASPTPGQKCWITFLSGNLLTPVISGICDDEYYKNTYSQKTNADSGAYINNIEVINTDTSINTTPMIEDYTNTISKSEYEEYTEIDINQETRKIIMESDKYKNTEDGITNLNTKSTIKIDEDGNINIFVNNNTGIKISTLDNTIDIYGTFRINGKEIVGEN